jgi:hypothetical protein
VKVHNWTVEPTKEEEEEEAAHCHYLCHKFGALSLTQHLAGLGVNTVYSYIMSLNYKQYCHNKVIFILSVTVFIHTGN